MDVIYQVLFPSLATFDTPPVARQIIPGLEKALTGMKPGAKQQSMVPADQAYGLYEEKNTITVPKDKVPENVKVGTLLRSREGGAPVRVVEVHDKTVVIDTHHPLAGKDHRFDVKILSVEPAPKSSEGAQMAKAQGERGGSVTPTLHAARRGRMKTFMSTALVCLALVGSGCMLFVAKETLYLQAAQDRATQPAVRERLGVPWQTASTLGGETMWVYEVWEEHPGSRVTSPGMWCDEYVLTFDPQGVLRRWTHKSQLHGGTLMPRDCVDNGFKPVS